MQFHDYVTSFSIAKKLGLGKVQPEDFYRDAIMASAKRGDYFEAAQFEVERRWIAARRPYYNVWPSIIPMLLRLKLEFDSGFVECPLDVMCVRLPKEKNPLTFEFDKKEQVVRTLMMNRSLIRGEKAISIWIDISEYVYNLPVYTFQNIQCVEGKTLEDSLLNLPRHKSAKEGIVIPHETVVDCVRFCCTLCLLENDSEIIEPDVLAEDRAKYESTGDQKYVDKAHRRGKIGWEIGRNLHVSPHVRGPSPAALYWTGKGGLIPKIRFRRGCIVHRKQIEDIPTGYLDDERGKLK